MALRGEMTISRISRELGRSTSWTSECVDKLVKRDWIDSRRAGFSKYVRIGNNVVGERLITLINENGNLNFNLIFTCSGLRVLPLLLDPGSGIGEISEKTSLSGRTIRDLFRLWKGMGIIYHIKTDGRYQLSPIYRNLIDFVEAYSQHENKRKIKERFPTAAIIYNRRDEVLFSLDRPVSGGDFLTAAGSRLEELGYDIIMDSYYLFHSPGLDQVSETEAVIQTIWIDPINPRPRRILREYLLEKDPDMDELISFGLKYGLQTTVKREVDKIAGKKEIP